MEFRASVESLLRGRLRLFTGKRLRRISFTGIFLDCAGFRVSAGFLVRLKSRVNVRLVFQTKGAL